MAFVKMFKSSKNDLQPNKDSLTKTYDRNKLAQIISKLSFFKIVEDNFNYEEAKINE